MIKDLLIFLCSIIAYVFLIFVPIYIYIKKKKSNDVFYYLRLKKNWRGGILLGIIISAFYMTILVITGKYNNSLNLDFNIGIRWATGLLVGVLEEIPFRGFLLRLFEEKFPFIKSNLFVTLLFVLMHFPTWILNGTNIFEAIIKIGIVSFAFGYLTKEYDSLWPAIICHSVFNLSIWMGLA
ncbi:hypothetical protein SAMN04487886_107219 [Clostridium sp. DSM 8431]|uniref:CPBP family intramembrane glutamic endopeptidase n=1 Tax=Clostridium sp. DSM 8431 TaxID=1761781 RepID=UPI0008E29766|nr:CPBP family intramembrane glutamic endopeptidase [Clostridium sp. DSM 8431]SFU60602.1 hypothetical protein SAMN04487886_107219 [Clostridium sp. DSM 8431]